MWLRLERVRLGHSSTPSHRSRGQRPSRVSSGRTRCLSSRTAWGYVFPSPPSPSSFLFSVSQPNVDVDVDNAPSPWYHPISQHTTFSEPSTCLAQITAAYFTNGTVSAQLVFEDPQILNADSMVLNSHTLFTLGLPTRLGILVRSAPGAAADERHAVRGGCRLRGVRWGEHGRHPRAHPQHRRLGLLPESHCLWAEWGGDRQS